jgi:hypothetical protein
MAAEKLQAQRLRTAGLCGEQRDRRLTEFGRSVKHVVVHDRVRLSMAGTEIDDLKRNPSDANLGRRLLHVPTSASAPASA